MKKLLVVSLLIAFSLSLFAGGIALSGVGARAISMGGAMRGLADDYSAMYWNPAGLAFANQNTVALSLAGINHSGEIEDLDGVDYENDDKTYMFPNLYYVKKAESKFNYGIGVYVPYGLGSQWDMAQAVQGYQPAQLPVYDTDGNFVVMQDVTWDDDFDKYDTKAEIAMVDVHPGFSYQITDCLSVGAGLSIMYGNIKLIKTQISHVDFPAGEGLVLKNIMPTSMDMEGDGFAFGGNFGFMYKPNHKWSLGLSGKLPMKMTLEGEADILMMANDITAMYTALELGINESTSDVEAELNLPADVGFGAAYNVNENWLISADFTYTMWESFDEAPIEFDGKNALGQDLEDSRILMEWDNTIRFSIGTEYCYNDWKFRGGYWFDESPIPEETMGPTWPDINDKSSFNVGLGYKWNNYQIDGGFEYIMSPETEVDEPNVSEDGTVENFPGTYNSKIMAFNVGISYTF